MLNLLRNDSLNFAPTTAPTGSPSSGSSSVFDPDFNTPQDNGGNNPWAPGYLGPEWDVDNNTPQDNGGNNPWAPGTDYGVWY